MHTSPELSITSATLRENNLTVSLSDGRIVIYPISGMTWITAAPLEQQQNFAVTEWEIYWRQIDDGLTLERILSPEPRIDFTVRQLPNWERFQEVTAARQERSHRSKSAAALY